MVDSVALESMKTEDETCDKSKPYLFSILLVITQVLVLFYSRIKNRTIFFQVTQEVIPWQNSLPLHLPQVQFGRDR